MDFAYSHNAEMMRDTLRTFMERHLLPQNAAWHRLADRGIYPLEIVEPLKERAKEAGL